VTTDNLVAKLRRVASAKPGGPVPEELDHPNGWVDQLNALLNEAADTIERLEKTVKELV
jgi:hypothetical protein